MAKIHKRRSALKGSIGRAMLCCVTDAVLMVLLAAAAIWRFGTICAWVAAHPELFGIPTAVLLPAAAAILLIVLILRLHSNVHSAVIRRAGAQGEDQALKQLAKALPNQYHLFNNVVVTYEGGRSETDLIVVGPGGVTVVEVKNYSGELQGKAGDNRLTHIKTGGTESVYNPLRQVATHVHRVSGYLRQNHRGVWVQGAVYFVNPRLKVKLSGRSETPWFTSDQLDELTGMLCGGQMQLTAKQVEGIVEVLLRI